MEFATKNEIIEEQTADDRQSFSVRESMNDSIGTVCVFHYVHPPTPDTGSHPGTYMPTTDMKILEDLVLTVRGEKHSRPLKVCVVHYGHVGWTVGRATRVRTRKGIRETTR